MTIYYPIIDEESVTKLLNRFTALYDALKHKEQRGLYAGDYSHLRFQLDMKKGYYELLTEIWSLSRYARQAEWDTTISFKKTGDNLYVYSSRLEYLPDGSTKERRDKVCDVWLYGLSKYGCSYEDLVNEYGLHMGVLDNMYSVLYDMIADFEDEALQIEFREMHNPISRFMSLFVKDEVSMLTIADKGANQSIEKLDYDKLAKSWHKPAPTLLLRIDDNKFLRTTLDGTKEICKDDYLREFSLS